VAFGIIAFIFNFMVAFLLLELVPKLMVKLHILDS
jgi:hypothetical protein